MILIFCLVHPSPKPGESSTTSTLGTAPTLKQFDNINGIEMYVYICIYIYYTERERERERERPCYGPEYGLQQGGGSTQPQPLPKARHNSVLSPQALNSISQATEHWA